VNPIADASATRSQRAPLSIVLPVWNETHRAAPSIVELLDHLATLAPDSELIFVDDGSTDGTAELIEKVVAERDPDANCRVLRRAHEGKGSATRAGILAARSPIIGFCDIDLATPLASFTTIVEAAERAPVLAIGSRDLLASRLVRRESPAREFLGRAYNRAVQAIVTPGIVDTQCGAKVARRDVWLTVLAHSVENAFAWDVEVCALARAAGIPVLEVAIDWRHDDGSNINVIRDGVRMLSALPRIRRRAAAFARSHRDRRRTESWVDRSTISHIVAALRRFGSLSNRGGTLVDLTGDGDDLTARLGWSARDVVAVVDHAPHRAAAITRVVADPADTPLSAHSAAAVVVRGALTAPVAAEAARVLRADGVLVAFAVGGDPRLVQAIAREHGFAIELAAHAWSWRSRLPRDATARSTAALVLTALERLAVFRLGARPPRGAAAIVVGRRLGPR
jgi:dolichyl-phosphate beta-glucosyltransferase